MGLEDKDENKGIIPKAFTHIFGCIDASSEDQKFLVRCSYLEIYNESILDLLGKDTESKHEIKEDPNKGIYVKDLTNVIVKSVQDIDRTMKNGYHEYLTK